MGCAGLIYVAPYLSIIEQNADAIREAIGEAAGRAGIVLEHHSLTESGEDRDDEPQSSAADHLAENWDAPVVITTSVQFFESLFAKSPRRCRKLHNIARSVVILDECQSLPRDLVAPTVDMLRELAPYLGASFVLCTATQPAWERSDALPEGLDGVTEIAPDPAHLAQRLRRVRIQWPQPEGAPWSWEEAAAQMTESGQPALCIVNTKAAARALYLAARSRLGSDDDLLHLSTSMCPEHRRRVLADCRSRLAAGRACWVVSTQLVEAGVDLDFPLVLREMGPLDSIAQAAGRCNREGRLGREGGEVIVFRSAGGRLPPGHYSLATATTLQQLAAASPPDLADPETMRGYFRTLYNKTRPDPRAITASRAALNFPEVARLYRLIDDATESAVALGWEAERTRIQDLLDALARSPSRATFRALVRYSVNLYARDVAELTSAIRQGPAGSIAICDAPYDEKLGILAPQTGAAMSG